MEGQNYFAALTDIEGAKAVARRLFDQYDKSKKGEINQTDTIPMIVEAYKSFNFQFSPQTQDINAYFRVLDRNGDGRVTYEDIEQNCIRYLCPNLQPQQQQPPQQEEHRKHAKHKPNTAQEKLQLAADLFAKYDNDGSGQLDYQEIKSLLKEFYELAGMGYNPTDQDVEMWVRGIDKDNTGSIDRDEYLDFQKAALKRAGNNVDNIQLVLPNLNRINHQ